MEDQINNLIPTIMSEMESDDEIEGSPVDEDGYYDYDTDKEKVDFIFFGLVSGIEVELGYFSLTELQSVRGEIRLTR